MNKITAKITARLAQLAERPEEGALTVEQILWIIGIIAIAGGVIALITIKIMAAANNINVQ